MCRKLVASDAQFAHRTVSTRRMIYDWVKKGKVVGLLRSNKQLFIISVEEVASSHHTHIRWQWLHEPKTLSSKKRTRYNLKFFDEFHLKRPFTKCSDVHTANEWFCFSFETKQPNKPNDRIEVGENGFPSDGWFRCCCLVLFCFILFCLGTNRSSVHWNLCFYLVAL